MCKAAIWPSGQLFSLKLLSLLTEGKFKELGLCTYASWEVVSFLGCNLTNLPLNISCYCDRLMSTTSVRVMDGCCPLSTRECTMPSLGY